jgi:D-alanyl-D-alanine carboxypeptidase/D-alanyl-D-alanine-endopeptidase (penicillin-binding protein 4)
VTVIACCLSACASRAATPAVRPVEDLTPVERLQRELQAVFDDRSTAHAQWAVSVQSLRTGATLFSLNRARFMIPASSQKLLTSAVAAERLGWDYRYTTRLVSTAPIGEDGTLDGDVVIVGSGDPTINPRHPERWRAFDDWAAALREKGLKIVSGRLIGDDNAFAEPAWGFGWSWDDLSFGYGAEPSALQFNENQVEVQVGPGMAEGSRAIISTSPLGSGLVVEHRVETVAAGAPTSLSIARMPGTSFLSVRGRIAVDAKPATLYASVENPTRFFVTALREALARHGIYVAGGVADVDELHAPLTLVAVHELIVDHSPPLVELVDVTLKWSRNLYAETMLLSLSPPGEPATAMRALEPLRDALGAWGVAPEYYLARDGSGLSRYNYVTADAMTGLLTAMWMDPRHAEPFQSTLPVAGVSGTLANRMKGTAAEGRVRAKTGTMSNVRSLCGYVTTLDGEPMVFAMLANDFRIAPSDIDAMMDRALERIVSWRR